MTCSHEADCSTLVLRTYVLRMCAAVLKGRSEQVLGELLRTYFRNVDRV